jgi:hypothetical protein
MSYAVIVSLDIENSKPEDYDCVEERLEKIGLSRKVEGEKKHVLPSTTFYGKFEGNDAKSIREEVCEKVVKAFERCDASGKVFILAAGEEHGWAMRYPKGD